MTHFRELAFTDSSVITTYFRHFYANRATNTGIMPTRCVTANCGNVKDVARNGISLHRLPEFTSQSVTATARPRSPIAWYWDKISSHSTGHRKSRILRNQKNCLLKYSRKEAHSFRLINKFGVRCTLRAVVSNFRESGDRSENSNFFLFAPKDPFGELFSKIIF